MEESVVIPDHSVLVRENFLVIMVASRRPEWCERPLEQTILEPEAEVEIEPDLKGPVYDGNNRGAKRAQEFSESGRF